MRAPNLGSSRGRGGRTLALLLASVATLAGVPARAEAPLGGPPQLTLEEVAVMLASTGGAAGEHPLRVVLATTHLPLRDVPAAVTPEAIGRAARVTRDGLRRWFGVAEPRIALCAG